MKATPSPDLISDVLNTMLILPKKEKVIQDVHILLNNIVLNTFSQIDIITIHYQMRNGLSLSEVFSKYVFNFDSQLLDKTTDLLENPKIIDNNLDFLFFIVMHTYVALELLHEKSKLNPPINNLLKSLLILSQKFTGDSREGVAEKVFKQVFASFLHVLHGNRPYALYKTIKILKPLIYYHSFLNISESAEIKSFFSSSLSIFLKIIAMIVLPNFWMTLLIILIQILLFSQK